MRQIALIPLTFVLLIGLTFGLAQAQQVVVTPKETNEILANPGMGWQTFHRTSKQDKNLPAWIPSTVHYIRWGWGELELQPGKLNTDLLDRVLLETRDAGQKLAFRVKCCSPYKNRPFHPAWIKDIGGKELMATFKGEGPFPIPDMDDPAILNYHLDFIKRLGECYDGHPDIDHLDLGSIGWWGEWHLSHSNYTLPSLENRMKVVDAYLAAFKKTPLIMLIGGRECTTYATQHGAGWRADSMGDMGRSSTSKWSHMRNSYPQVIPRTQVQDVWKTAPVAFEPPDGMRHFVERDWPLRWIFNYALACHGSYFNGKSGRLPDDPHFRAELERFLQRLGYRIVLKELAHPAQAEPGAKLTLSMKWQNVGSAPCYKPYQIAYRLTNDQGFVKTFVGNITVNHWFPGSIELFTDEFFKEPQDLPPGPAYDISDTISLPTDLPTGKYTIAVAVVDQTSVPVVQLAIKGRAKDGWYPLSEIQVVK